MMMAFIALSSIVLFKMGNEFIKRIIAIVYPIALYFYFAKKSF